MDRTRISRFPRGECHGAGAEIILENWDKIPYRLRTAIVQTIEGEHTRGGKVRPYLQITDDFRFHIVSSGKKAGYTYFTEQQFTTAGKMAWRTIPSKRAEQIITSSRVKSVWGKRSGYSHIGRYSED